MKKVLNSRLFLVLITAIICITGTVYATQVSASNINYGNKTVAQALDDIYGKLIHYDCVTGSVLWTQTEKENGKVIADFEPSYFVVFANNANTGDTVFYYNKDVDATKYYHLNINSNPLQLTNIVGGAFSINNNLKIQLTSNNWLNKTVYYTVCK